MFDQLVSSKAKRQVAPVRSLVVGMLHGIVIAGAIRVTEQLPEAAPVEGVAIPIIYEHHPTAVARSAIPDPAAPTIPVDAPVLLPAPVDVPISIPPVTPGPPIDPAARRHILWTGVPGSSPAGGDSLSLHGVLVAAEVDDPAMVVDQPSPRYPPVLQQAGIEGRVLVEFVIDTAGHMEGASLRVLESSNPGFDAAAGETVHHSLSVRPGYAGIRSGSARFNRSSSGSRRADGRGLRGGGQRPR